MNQTHQHDNSQNKDLLSILAQCADECDTCFDACLDNERTDALTKAIRLCRDCAKICRVTASFVASNSEVAKQVVSLCADICKKCAEVCSQDTDIEKETMHCAKICRDCEEACRSYK
ncbi:four-helix bundle copper-binding protein [Pontibacter actiniarum]|uniref:Four-helix bundle copper-binding protein n=1 Tax=Pontibacter actiniarum TaxID=323450 RepID=A0A1X9YZ07_9BACT|nr:four-helix bundle copper-binding protein [Pontibacter actiniarum]ARS38135.1 hypothetical protein CA264_21565 [Pontibacter actiniarum]